eukprot:1159329-Pelagomonas_calceolata.AAC.4
MNAATSQMARNFMGVIARVFALTAGLYGCQIWATDKLSFLPSFLPSFQEYFLQPGYGAECFQ